MTLVFSLEGQEGCKVVTNILYGFDGILTFASAIKKCYTSREERKILSDICKYKIYMNIFPFSSS